MQRGHIVQITADNSDVFNANFGETVPDWARRGRIQVVGSDTDWLFSVRVNGQEYARDSAPHVSAADNTQGIDYRKAHIVFPLARGRVDNDILVDVNVVTAGVGLVGIQYES